MWYVLLSEPNSETYLHAKRVLVAKNKVDALAKLLEVQPTSIPSKFRDADMTSDELRNIIDAATTLPDTDLMMTPTMAFRYVARRSVEGRQELEQKMVGHIQNRPYYAGIFLDLYAMEDFLDQHICRIAEEKGVYDCIVLTHMVGSRQIVQEILDVRDRKKSFKSLAWVTQ